MAKILRKYTTIPEQLYVNRNADTQLSQIIQDMDRPGYVLVARQMGKTNLLLNAKRNIENKETKLIYIDLSILFSNESEFYRNIIDTILDVKDFTDTNLFRQIQIRRSKNNLAPHKEHLNELRAILKLTKNKIVIILDEIDALRSTNYSDQIFAQIRSIYFARTNFPEFENLTYILSGVIDPKELIKDKNKSPFNIGEPIYLDDFTLVEHKEFIKKSKLPIGEDIVNEIYHWTNGNPRLNYDICSEIENLLNQNKKITKTSLEQLIHQKYLMKFELPPIDNLREIVILKSHIKNALIKIKNGEKINDIELLKELFLTGFIKSDFENITIKNKIVDLSLPSDWLLSIEKDPKILYDYYVNIGKNFAKTFNGSYQSLKNKMKELLDSILKDHDSIEENRKKVIDELSEEIENKLIKQQTTLNLIQKTENELIGLEYKSINEEKNLDEKIGSIQGEINELTREIALTRKEVKNKSKKEVNRFEYLFIQMTFWFSSISLMIIYWFLWYNSLFSSSFNEIITNKGVYSAIIDPYLIVSAFQNGNYLGILISLILTTIPLSLSYIYHSSLKEKVIKSIIISFGALLLALVLDFFLAYRIVEHVFLYKQFIGEVANVEFSIVYCLQEVSFYLIFFISFFSYIIWGFFFMRLREFQQVDEELINKMQKLHQTKDSTLKYFDEFLLKKQILGENFEKQKVFLNNQKLKYVQIKSEYEYELNSLTNLMDAYRSKKVISETSVKNVFNAFYSGFLSVYNVDYKNKGDTTEISKIISKDGIVLSEFLIDVTNSNEIILINESTKR